MQRNLVVLTPMKKNNICIWQHKNRRSRSDISTANRNLRLPQRWDFPFNYFIVYVTGSNTAAKTRSALVATIS